MARPCGGDTLLLSYAKSSRSSGSDDQLKSFVLLKNGDFWGVRIRAASARVR